MSETYPRKTLCETLFVGHTPSSVGIDGKITNYFSFMQDFLRFIMEKVLGVLNDYV